MFFVEENIMSQRAFGLKLSRFVAFPALLLAALAGCHGAETSLYGYIDVVPGGVPSAACEAPLSGHLRLDGMQVADELSISADELCHQWVVRKELPAGLYTVSWQGSDTVEATWGSRQPVIVNVFPQQTTILRVLTVEPDPEPLSQAWPEDAIGQL